MDRARLADRLFKQADVSEQALETLGQALMRTAVPAAISGPAGYGYGHMGSPTPSDLKIVQADYIKRKLEQAIGDLERRKRLEALKGRMQGAGTLRI